MNKGRRGSKQRQQDEGEFRGVLNDSFDSSLIISYMYYLYEQYDIYYL